MTELNSMLETIAFLLSCQSAVPNSFEFVTAIAMSRLEARVKHFFFTLIYTFKYFHSEKEGKNNAKKTDGKNRNAHELDKRSKGSSKPASSRASTHLDKKSQQMLAELHRLKRQMTEFQLSIYRPPV